MTDSEFITFQDDFYDLLEKYGVKLIDCDHSQWDEICNSRNILVDSIDKMSEATMEPIPDLIIDEEGRVYEIETKDLT